MTPILCFHPATAEFPGVSTGGESGGSGIGLYRPDINMLLAGDMPPDDDPNYSGVQVILQQQDISFLADDTIIMVNIYARGISVWKRTRDTTAPGNDTGTLGVITPSNYDVVFNPFVLFRVAGF